MMELQSLKLQEFYVTMHFLYQPKSRVKGNLWSFLETTALTPQPIEPTTNLTAHSTIYPEHSNATLHTY